MFSFHFFGIFLSFSIRPPRRLLICGLFDDRHIETVRKYREKGVLLLDKMSIKL